MPLGIYISVPFCRSKCSYCNFSSGVFAKAGHEKYVERLCADIRGAEQAVREMGGKWEGRADSLYLGGGTPTLLEPEQLRRIFATLRETFSWEESAEVTVECAPAALSDEMLECLAQAGVNRVSLGVQSFVDAETRAVGRLHTRETTLRDIHRLRAAGIGNLSIDLIAGLPHQTRESWEFSLAETIATGGAHVSVYMLEVDEDSRLGRELLAGGARYHAHFAPDEELTAELYERACETLESAGIRQYEISNFARLGRESAHNLKYWTRQPYLGFGVDAHSFVPAAENADQPANLKVEIANLDSLESIRMASPDSLDDYLAAAPLLRTPVSRRAAREESFFLGLRLNRGLRLPEVTARFGRDSRTETVITELQATGFLDYDAEGDAIRLTPAGRLMANEVFERFLED